MGVTIDKLLGDALMHSHSVEDVGLTGLTTASIADSTDKRYVTDAQRTVISNTSGTNTGDQNLSGYQLTSQKSQANGYASLGSDGKVPTSELNPIAITSTFVVNSQAAQLALTAQEGDVAVRTDLSKTYIHNGGTAGTMADWTELATPTDSVLSVNSKTGAVTLTTADIADATDKRYITDAQKTVLSNTSGTNTGDQDLSGYALLSGRAGGQSLSGGTDANDDLVLQGTTNSTRTSSYVILQPNGGNVGIGTSTPSSPLEVTGNTIITGSARVNRFYAGTDGGGVGSGACDARAANGPTLSLFSTDAFSTTPYARLTFGTKYTSSGTYTTGPVIQGGKDNATDGNYGYFLSFYTRPHGQASTEQMRITSSGNVGIGTTNPDKLLSLSANKIGIASDASGNLSLVSNAYWNTADGRWEITGNNYSYGVGQFSVNGASFTYNNYVGSAVNEKFYWVTRFSIDSAGLVGIGADAAGGKLDVQQVSTTAAVPTLKLTQSDVSEEFIEFVSTSAANNTNPISTTAVGTYAGKLRINVNGTYYWLPFYNS